MRVFVPKNGFPLVYFHACRCLLSNEVRGYVPDSVFQGLLDGPFVMGIVTLFPIPADKQTAVSRPPTAECRPLTAHRRPLRKGVTTFCPSFVRTSAGLFNVLT